MQRSLILASTSPYRRELLTRLGLVFKVMEPDFIESIDPGVAPQLQVKHLALGKARSLVATCPDAVIIGSDQVFCDASGRVLGKPGDMATAQAQLERMAGKKHHFYTGLAVVDARNGQTQTASVISTVVLRDLSSRQIKNYLERESPFDCAGSFKIEGLGISLMEQVGGTDYTALIGLPLISLTTMLQSLGLDPLDVCAF
ncbi:MAG: Maf family protein [Desulfuromonadaceae bacterium]|nr:Maf family protein [Desulfuromonas sp.]MDY0185032.1 Maf family protein [Desulfuromonadaceae bacterium]